MHWGTGAVAWNRNSFRPRQLPQISRVFPLHRERRLCYVRFAPNISTIKKQRDMISNERPSPFARRPQRPQFSSFNSQPAYAKPATQDTTIRTERLQVERKTYVIALKENDRGRFLRIVEESNGHRDMIIVPSTGLEDFNKILSEMAATAPKSETPAAE